MFRPALAKNRTATLLARLCRWAERWGENVPIWDAAAAAGTAAVHSPDWLVHKEHAQRGQKTLEIELKHILSYTITVHMCIRKCLCITVLRM